MPDRILDDVSVLCEGGRITAIKPSGAAPSFGMGALDDTIQSTNFRAIDGANQYLVPGFIDIHVHGGAGADFMDANVETVRTACRAHARHGTTLLFPTTTTGSRDQIHHMIESVVIAQRDWNIQQGAMIAGVHLYGPYFAPDKVGCHSLAGRREPTADEYEDYFRSGAIRIATCAAELEGAYSFYRAAARNDCLITCGHSNASWPEMQQAFEQGMRHVDHFWCAMSNVSSVRARLGVPMRGSMLEFVLAEPEMSTEVIADGCHLAPELLDFAFRMKGNERLCLVTDCSRALDMPPGRYRFGAHLDGTWFESDGQVGWAGPGVLASSVRGMDHMVRHMFHSTSASLIDVVRMASLTPAERTGVSHETGSIEVGKRADLVLLSRDLEVISTFIAGEEFRTQAINA